MQIHTQSAIRYAEIRPESDVLEQRERHAHMALEVACPRCEARNGAACKQGGTFMPKLSVHRERLEAFL